MTDAHLVDAQAAFESALMLKTALDGGVDYVLHAFGMMSSYMAASLEKWVLDEEVARLLLASRGKNKFDPGKIDLDYMLEMGSEGNYLSSPQTFKSFRSLYQGSFLNVQSLAAWKESGGLSAAVKAKAEVEKRIAAYEEPYMDQGLKVELARWIAVRKKKLI